MMTPIHFSDNCDVDDRNLHLQTDYRPGESGMVSILFDKGQVRNREAVPVPGDTGQATVKDWVLAQHRMLLLTVNLIFKLHDKVCSIRHVTSLCYLGSLYLRWGFISEANDVLELAFQRQPESPDAAEFLSEACIRAGNPERALAILEHAFKAGHTRKDRLWIKTAKARLASGHIEQATADLEKAAALDPGSLEIRLMKCLAVLMMIEENRRNKETGSRKAAETTFLMVMTEAAGNAGPFMRGRLETLLQTFQSGKIRETIDGIRNLDPKYLGPDLMFYHVFYLQFLYGRRGRELKPIQQMVRNMEALIRQYPNDDRLRSYLGTGYMLECRHRFQQMLEAFHSARKLDPDSRIYAFQTEQAEQIGEDYIQFVKKVFQS
ncbi:hypothetical protein JW948_11885 [bacterium]|nr:hypothetical protein [bacterium]